MADREMMATYVRLRAEYERSASRLVEALERVAIACIREVLPSAEFLEVRGALNEDWVRTLRIQRVRAGDDAVLFDVRSGHADASVEQAVDEVDIEYLDLLIDLTGEDYMGDVELRA